MLTAKEMQDEMLAVIQDQLDGESAGDNSYYVLQDLTKYQLEIVQSFVRSWEVTPTKD